MARGPNEAPMARRRRHGVPTGLARPVANQAVRETPAVAAQARIIPPIFRAVRFRLRRARCASSRLERRCWPRWSPRRGRGRRCRSRISSAAGSALRPAVMGPSGGVSTGHPLTTAAAFEILLKGGNAFDAGVAALLAGGVLEQDLYSLGGEALVLVYPTEGTARSPRSSARAGRRQAVGRRLVSVAQQDARRARVSIPQSCPARCTRRSRCSRNGAR